MAVLEVATFNRRRVGRRILEPTRVGGTERRVPKKALFVRRAGPPSELIENIRRTGFLASGGAEFYRRFFDLFFVRAGNRFGRASDRRPSSLCGRALARLALNDRL